MRRTATVMMMAAGVVLFATSLSAQAPNFAGKWTLNVDPNAAAPPAGGGGGRGGGGRGGGGGGFCGMTCDITQDATTLTIKRTTQAGETSTAYKLDGKEGTISQQGPNGPTEIKYTAKVEGGKITVSTTRDFGQGPSTTKMEVSMDAGAMKVVTTAPGRGGGDPTVTTQTYKKG
jgi:hypothetical protein